MCVMSVCDTAASDIKCCEHEDAGMFVAVPDEDSVVVLLSRHSHSVLHKDLLCLDRVH